MIDELNELVAGSLLDVVKPPAGPEPDPRVTCLETIREYGLEQLLAADEAESLQRRHADYYLRLAEAAEPRLAGPDAMIWGQRLDRDHNNLWTALRWGQDQKETLTALRLAGALWRFWSQRGHLSEGRHWLDVALTLPQTPDIAASLHVKTLIAAARLAIDQRSYEDAAGYSEQAMSLARRHGDDLVGALNLQGTLARLQNRYDDAADHHREALAARIESATGSVQV